MISRGDREDRIEEIHGEIAGLVSEIHVLERELEKLEFDGDLDSFDEEYERE